MMLRLMLVLGVLTFMVLAVCSCEKSEDETLQEPVDSKSQHQPQDEEQITEENLDEQLDKIEKEIEAEMFAGR